MKTLKPILLPSYWVSQSLQTFYTDISKYRRVNARQKLLPIHYLFNHLNIYIKYVLFFLLWGRVFVQEEVASKGYLFFFFDNQYLECWCTKFLEVQSLMFPCVLTDFLTFQPVCLLIHFLMNFRIVRNTLINTLNQVVFSSGPMLLS